jgi:hypothetical protein
VPPGTADDAVAAVPSTAASAAAAAEGTPAEAAAEAAKKADASTSRRVLAAADDDDADEFHAEQKPHVETIATISKAVVATTDATPRQKAVVERRFVVRDAPAGIVRREFNGVDDGNSRVILATMMSRMDPPERRLCATR